MANEKRKKDEDVEKYEEIIQDKMREMKSLETRLGEREREMEKLCGKFQERIEAEGEESKRVRVIEQLLE